MAQVQEQLAELAAEYERSRAFLEQLEQSIASCAATAAAPHTVDALSIGSEHCSEEDSDGSHHDNSSESRNKGVGSRVSNWIRKKIGGSRRAESLPGLRLEQQQLGGSTDGPLQIDDIRRPSVINLGAGALCADPGAFSPRGFAGSQASPRQFPEQQRSQELSAADQRRCMMQRRTSFSVHAAAAQALEARSGSGRLGGEVPSPSDQCPTPPRLLPGRSTSFRSPAVQVTASADARASSGTSSPTAAGAALFPTAPPGVQRAASRTGLPLTGRRGSNEGLRGPFSSTYARQLTDCGVESYSSGASGMPVPVNVAGVAGGGSLLPALRLSAISGTQATVSGASGGLSPRDSPSASDAAQQAAADGDGRRRLRVSIAQPAYRRASSSSYNMQLPSDAADQLLPDAYGTADSPSAVQSPAASHRLSRVISVRSMGVRLSEEPSGVIMSSMDAAGDGDDSPASSAALPSLQPASRGSIRRLPLLLAALSMEQEACAEPGSDPRAGCSPSASGGGASPMLSPRALISVRERSLPRRSVSFSVAKRPSLPEGVRFAESSGREEGAPSPGGVGFRGTMHVI